MCIYKQIYVSIHPSISVIMLKEIEYRIFNNIPIWVLVFGNFHIVRLNDDSLYTYIYVYYIYIYVLYIYICIIYIHICIIYICIIYICIIYMYYIYMYYIYMYYIYICIIYICIIYMYYIYIYMYYICVNFNISLKINKSILLGKS